MLHFGCTACGRCCHDLRLRLSIDEALRWLDRGGAVEIWCDALPAAADFATPDMADYRESAFAGRSGSLDIVVGLLIVATFTGPCPNLLPDMRCGDYAERPNICRIYPAETLPGRAPHPTDKRCPPEAWSAAQPPMFDGAGATADAVTRLAIAGAQAARRNETADKARLASLLGIDTAALRHEGFTAWRPTASDLRAALLACRRGEQVLSHWVIASPSAATTALITDAGAVAVAPPDHAGTSYIALTS